MKVQVTGILIGMDQVEICNIMMRYKHLTKQMRKELKKLLDSGEKTPGEIRNNIEESFIMDHQDEYIAVQEVNDKIDDVNKSLGTHITYVKYPQPIVIEAGYFDPKTAKIYDETLEGEMLYFINNWELRNEKKKATNRI